MKNTGWRTRISALNGQIWMRFLWRMILWITMSHKSIGQGTSGWRPKVGTPSGIQKLGSAAVKTNGTVVLDTPKVGMIANGKLPVRRTGKATGWRTKGGALIGTKLRSPQRVLWMIVSGNMAMAWQRWKHGAPSGIRRMRAMLLQKLPKGKRVCPPSKRASVWTCMIVIRRLLWGSFSRDIWDGILHEMIVTIPAKKKHLNFGLNSMCLFGTVAFLREEDVTRRKKQKPPQLVAFWKMMMWSKQRRVCQLHWK